MTYSRGGVGVASMGGLVYAIGGHDGQRYLNTVEAYDPVTNSWRPVTDIKDCRAGAGVAWANCR
uniref:Kelch-like protein n=1 Tax=Angiostrongylus cantonensis TaxID=6313 RepID=A0A0K0DGB3_ANGCA